MHEAMHLKITDINSKQIYSEKLSNPESFVDLSNFKKGIYMFSLFDQNDKLIESKKVIKE